MVIESHFKPQSPLPISSPLSQLCVVGEVVSADLERVEDDLHLLPVLGEEEVGAVGRRGVVGGVPGRIEPALLGQMHLHIRHLCRFLFQIVPFKVIFKIKLFLVFYDAKNSKSKDENIT